MDDDLNARWHIDPKYDPDRHGRFVWIFAGEARRLASGTVGPTPICETTYEIAQRIVADHNARAEARETMSDNINGGEWYRDGQYVRNHRRPVALAHCQDEETAEAIVREHNARAETRGDGLRAVPR